MTGACKTKENQTQVSLRSHGPWKSLRDSHIPTAPTVFVSQNLSKPNSRKETLAADRFAPTFRLILQ
jgi:hypothetical protein